MKPLEITIAEDKDCPQTFRVEWFGEDGECYGAIFFGPSAMQRAMEYEEFVHQKWAETDALNTGG